MYTGMLGASAFMNWRGGLRTASGVAWFATGAIIGWPFSGALILPFALEEGLLLAMSLGDAESFVGGVQRIVKGALAAIGILVGGPLLDFNIHTR